MRHIKEFENLNVRYKVGDYILLKEYVRTLNIELECEIVEISNNFGIGIGDYFIRTININYNKEVTRCIKHHNIQRKMKQHEIEEYLIKKDTRKYNL